MIGTTDSVWNDYVPPRIDTTGPKPDQERMPIFYVTELDSDGQPGEVEYTAPRRVSAPVAIRAIREVALRGPEAGSWFMLENSLTPAALKVLTESEYVTYEDAQKVLRQLGRLYYGQLQELKDPGGK